MKITFCGDIMPGGAFHYSDKIADDKLVGYLQKSDLRVATLEAAIGEGRREQYDKVKAEGRYNIIYAKPEDVRKLKALNINVVSLANNHICDLGERGLTDAIDLCYRNGIAPCGAGKNLEEAKEPAVVKRCGKTIAVLGRCLPNEAMGYVRYATSHSYGVAPLFIDELECDIRKAKLKYDYVVVMPHWGEEYEYFPYEECKQMAYRMIDAGADAVVGGHTHCIEPMVMYHGRPIFFSLGNFAFPDYYMKPPRPMYYPESIEETYDYERVLGYPFPIYNYCVQVWPGKSRIGMLANVDLDRYRASYRLTCLTADNEVKLYRRWNRVLKRLRMFVMGLCVKSRFYRQILSVYYSEHNLVRKAIHYVSDKLHINYDIKVKYDRDCR